MLLILLHIQEQIKMSYNIVNCNQCIDLVGNKTRLTIYTCQGILGSSYLGQILP